MSRYQGRKALKRELTEVMNRKQKLALALRSQFRQPRGFAGWLAGWEMALRSSNRQRNVWAVGLLGGEPTDRVLDIGFGPGIAIPGPKPMSRTRSVGSTPSRPTAHTLRWRFDDRSAISHPASQPANPRGCLNWDRSASASFCFLFMTSVNSRLRA